MAMVLPLLYVVYDLFYTVGHRALHHRSVYKYVHKHHHRQRAPSRGNVDAVNVHPFEFVSGEYNHLFRYEEWGVEGWTGREKGVMRQCAGFVYTIYI